MAVDRQVVLVFGAESEGRVLAVDLHTGATLNTYRGNCSSPGAAVIIGSDHFAAAQSDKKAIHAWAWHKDAVVTRSFLSEHASALATSPCGTYLVAGGASGYIHLWETSTGQLLRQWPVHYKSVSALAFTSCGDFIISGGQDTAVHVWALMDAADATTDPSAAIDPFWSHSEHTLAVSGIAVGLGASSAIFVTCSLDSQFAVCSLGFREVLRKGQLPAGATCVALDPFEHAVYFGSVDGAVYQADLIGGDASDAKGASVQTIRAHRQRINSLAVSTDGCHLVTGSEDGSAKIVDLRSQQVVREVPHPARVPVTAVLAIDRPLFLLGAAAGSDGTVRARSDVSGIPSTAISRKGPRVARPLAALAKYPGPVAGAVGPIEGPLVVLHGTGGAGSEESRQTAHGAAVGGGGGTGPAGEGGRERELAMQLEAVQKELWRATQVAEQWRGKHAELHSLCLEAVIGGKGRSSGKR